MEGKVKSLSEKGRELYYKLKPKLEKKYRLEDYVAIAVKSGKYVVGKSAIEVMRKSEKKYPQEKFFVAQVGRLAGLLKTTS